ncbi:MAG TPA: prolipoprotein diacylglyceryl transferase [Gaiellaceae bacterium]|nr:prolipoprotein diacylglyceryl transferase [Gaiellaceae bacterium]
MTGVVLGYIPSPSSGTFSLGPLTLHMYGVMLLLAIAACLWLTGRRWVSWGGDWDLIFRVALWGVIAGVVGARLYHDITSWNQDPTIHAHWWGFAAVWDGGLGIWGAIPFGVLAGAWVVHRSGNSIPLSLAADALAPGLPLAQAIGRWGNYFNQELYGKPTNLPWGLKIDAEPGRTFHPTFLYEFVWDLAGVGVLLWVDRRFTIRRPALFALYVAWYTTFRTFEEILRIDPSNHFLGMRVNFWVSLGIWVLSVGFFIWWQFFHTQEEKRPTPKPRPVPEGPRMAVPKSRVR